MFSFFFNDTATTEIYTLSLHDALPICKSPTTTSGPDVRVGISPRVAPPSGGIRSEEHTSELQSRLHLVCRLLLEKKNRRAPLASLTDSTPPDPSYPLPVTPLTDHTRCD